DPDEASLREWFGAGIVAAGMVSKLITNDLLKAGDWKGISARVRKTVDLIAKIRRELP
ncbi:MAG: bifunctional 4-hydroxy-2-oxoglutarate aldolase/2-dehydro-3-deoxy-phosphogluconate aldolase, partial [Caulobacterales bacterium]|nr:bifunctional 4-hydroxy-2-oxoglutarate aldolase/2-dehydro-3-deoxy-phosphogluconate aldolase [Caulobacterales bacterium]